MCCESGEWWEWTRMTLWSVYGDRIEGEGVMGRPPVKWINRVGQYGRKLVDEVLNVVWGSARTGKVGDASALAMKEDPVGEQGITDIDRKILIKLGECVQTSLLLKSIYSIYLREVLFLSQPYFLYLPNLSAWFIILPLWMAAHFGGHSCNLSKNG